MKNAGKGDLIQLCAFPLVMLVATILVTVALNHLSVRPSLQEPNKTTFIQSVQNGDVTLSQSQMASLLESSRRVEQSMEDLMKDQREFVSNLPYLMLAFFMAHVTFCVSVLRKLKE
jgi:Spy/CpxP family protein refolding chaperone